MHSMRDFFDRHSPAWDSYQRPFDYDAVGVIIDRIAPGPEDRVLDVGCGTGILVEPLQKKGVRDYLGLDISAGMATVFRSKYPELSFIIGDFAQASIKCASRSRVIIFNAFPHFPDEAEVFAQAFRILIPGGTLTIAHSMNREALDEHHRHAGIAVQDHVLIADDAFHRLYGEAGFTNVTVENSTLFYSSGRKPSV